jgi:hypothetical protein
MKTLNQIRTILAESIAQNEEIKIDLVKAKPEDVVKAYQKDKSNARFKGMTPETITQTALSDISIAKKAAGVKEGFDIVDTTDDEGGSMTLSEIDEIADMADDLYYAMQDHNEYPAWVQHKIAALHTSLRSVYDYYRRKKAEAPSIAVAITPSIDTDKNVSLSPVLPSDMNKC